MKALGAFTGAYVYIMGKKPKQFCPLGLSFAYLPRSQTRQLCLDDPSHSKFIDFLFFIFAFLKDEIYMPNLLFDALSALLSRLLFLYVLHNPSKLSSHPI